MSRRSLAPSGGIYATKGSRVERHHSLRGRQLAPQNTQVIQQRKDGPPPPPSASVALAQHIRPEWATRDSICVRLHNLPIWATTWIIYRTFAQYGTIDSIEIFEDSRQKRDGKGRIRFRYALYLCYVLLHNYVVLLYDSLMSEFTRLTLMHKDHHHQMPFGRRGGMLL